MSIFSRRIDKKPLGIYVHIPFCKSKCQYCDFYSLACKDDNLMDSYLDAVCAHIKEAGSLAPNYKVDTIYFGGGPPSAAALTLPETQRLPLKQTLTPLPTSSCTGCGQRASTG